MTRREINQLAVYHIGKDAERLLISRLRSLYIERTSEIIYVNKGNKLYGIISMGEALQVNSDGEVKINKNFTSLSDGNIVKAHEIFKDKHRIHKIPIVNGQGELIGDYSRWDDMLYVERNHNLYMRRELVSGVLEQYDAVYIVEAVDKMNHLYLGLLKYLENFQIRFDVLKKEDFGGKLTKKAVYIFLNEDERRGIQCLYEIAPCRCYGYKNVDEVENEKGIQLMTYKNLLAQIMKKSRLERLGIRKDNVFYSDRVDEKSTMLLSALQKKGIKCFCLYGNEKNPTEYGKRLMTEVEERLICNPLNPDKPWPEKKANEEFYGELYKCKDYENEVAQKEIRQAITTFEYKKDIYGKYFNARNGRRVTCFQPEEYSGKIYFLGPCTMIGGYSEDQYTIESYLQKILNESGYAYRVENYGGMLRNDSEIDSRLEEIREYSKNDIVIYLLRSGGAYGIEGVSLEKLFEKNKIPSMWIADMDLYFHCNHNVNHMLAKELFSMIVPYLSNEKQEKKREIYHIDIQGIMRNYVSNQYLSIYFSGFNGNKFNSVGAIVMNCNPFSKGHRYLIEQACKRVELLIVFVVEEDESLFPFEDRFKMVKEGTKDLKNVMVVPSGDFILSKNNFRQYFTKLDDGAIECNAEYDINVFAEYVAKPLRITYRFAGDEPEDRVTRIYNETMERILPQKGVKFVKFERLKIRSEVVSASKIRKYLKEMEYKKAFSMVLDEVKPYLI